MWKFIGIILILFMGFFLAGVFRPLLSQLITNASTGTDSTNTFALALLATFGIAPLIFVFLRGFTYLRGGKDD
jgi:hypothetical protein